MKIDWGRQKHAKRKGDKYQMDFNHLQTKTFLNQNL